MRLEVTRKSDLAVRALRALAESEDRMKAPALADAIGSTAGFVAHVVNPLVRHGWVRSDPGPSGGYLLAVDLTSVSVLAVIEAIEGPSASERCVLVDQACDETGACALHVPWVSARSQLLTELAATPVAENLSPSGRARVQRSASVNGARAGWSRRPPDGQNCVMLDS
jgi:Rrf2 family protein